MLFLYSISVLWSVIGFLSLLDTRARQSCRRLFDVQLPLAGQPVGFDLLTLDITDVRGDLPDGWL